MPASYYHSLLYGATAGGSLDFYHTPGGLGNHAYMKLPNGCMFSSIPAEITVQGWMKQLQSASQEGVLIEWDGLNFMLGYAASSGVFQVFGGGVNSTITPSGGWDHVTYVRSVAGNTQKFYLNGSIVNTIATSTTPRTMTAGTERRAGGDGGGDTFWGCISDLRVWTVARSGAAIAGDYNKRLVGNETGLIGYWKLNEGSGITAYDSTSNANHGDLAYGGVAFAADSAQWSADSPVFV